MKSNLSDLRAKTSLIPANFKINVPFAPAGDQPKAIKQIVENLQNGVDSQVLLGVTGSGKTYTIANVIQEMKRPALVIAPNKTLAAQLFTEFREFFPENRVSYFVSYYDYYQPEAYVVSTDTYIEKDSAINEEIDKMRHSATRSVLEARDSIVIASVSCIYGLGAPEEYFNLMVFLEKGQTLNKQKLLEQLVYMQYERKDLEFARGTFRVRGEVVDIFPADQDAKALRITFFADEIEEISQIDSITGAVLNKLDSCAIYPLSHFLAGEQSLELAIRSIRRELNDHLAKMRREEKVFEAERLERRTLYDLEMLKEVGFCSGIENYSRHIAGRSEGDSPTTLIDYFPKDFLLFIDESHITCSQIDAMYKGDRSRKSNLVDYGFRLPSALDNRPLRGEEFWERVGQTVFVSATPANYEMEKSKGAIVEQINRPTGLLDPIPEIRPATNQVDDLIVEIKNTIAKGQRVLAITLTKKMSEDLSAYLRDLSIKCRYLHSEIKTIERTEILQALKRGEFDVLIGINLLREGIDLVEVGLVAILDADKEGFLRSTRSLIQTMGRAARNVEGRVILYADRITNSMTEAINETRRRRTIQETFNIKHGITPASAKKSSDTVAASSFIKVSEIREIYIQGKKIPVPKDNRAMQRFIEKLRSDMFTAAAKREYELAAEIRDVISKIQESLLFSASTNSVIDELVDGINLIEPNEKN